MSHDQICAWLGLPPGCWPPDHYTLLGLTPGETDLALIEQHVHERMARVRRYQLTHPDSATEAMNRLALALCCLTDEAARKTYNASLSAVPVPAAAPIPVSVPALAEAAPADPLAWLFGAWSPTAPVPPARRTDWDASPPPVRAEPTNPAAEAMKETVPAFRSLAVEAPPPPAPVDALLQAVRSSPQARRGLSTRAALYARIRKTRQLMDAWDRAGKYLSQHEQALSRNEGPDFVRQLRTVSELLRSLPPHLGETGQPGTYVMALARQADVVKKLQLYQPGQRETLARDWNDGRALLLAHHRFLRLELRAMRRRSRFDHAVRALAAGLCDHIGRVIFTIALTALYLVIFDLARQGHPTGMLGLDVLLFLLGLVAALFAPWGALLWRRTTPIESAPASVAPRPRVQKQLN